MGSRIVDRILHSVVLPAPFGPSRPWTSFSGTSNVSPASAVTSSPLGRHPLPLRNVLVRFCTRTLMVTPLVVSVTLPLCLNG